MTESTSNASSSPFAGADWLDPLEDRVRQSIRGFIEHLVESELEAFLGRPRYGRAAARSPVVATDIGSGSCWAPSGRPRCRCRGRGSRAARAGRENGAAKRCGPISA